MAVCQVWQEQLTMAPATDERATTKRVATGLADVPRAKANWARAHSPWWGVSLPTEPCVLRYMSCVRLAALL